MALSGPDRLVIRPTAKILLLTACSLGLASVAGAWVGIDTLVVGRLVGLVPLGVSLGLALMIYGNLAGYIWADSEQVGSTVPFKRWVGRRSEIARVWVGRSVGKYGAPSWDFVRADGSIAYTADVTVFGERGLSSVVEYLGVPIVDERRKG